MNRCGPGILGRTATAEGCPHKIMALLSQAPIFAKHSWLPIRKRTE